MAAGDPRGIRDTGVLASLLSGDPSRLVAFMFALGSTTTGASEGPARQVPLTEEYCIMGSGPGRTDVMERMAAWHRLFWRPPSGNRKHAPRTSVHAPAWGCGR